MPTRLGRRFAPDYHGHPPHLSPQDSAIWFEWYPTLDPKPQDLYFDVGLGAGRPTPPGTPEPYARMWEHITQKRADALLIYPHSTVILELREAATANAIGRLLTYAHLLATDDPFGLPIRCHLVTNAPDPDLPSLARAHNIEYTIV